MTPIPILPTVPPFLEGVVDGAPQLNVRYGPGREYPIMAVLDRGDAVRVVARAHAGSSWGQINNGGWLHCGYTSIDLEYLVSLPLGAILPAPSLNRR